jgi:DNA processing protein
VSASSSLIIIRPSDSTYPAALNEIADPPKQLYIWGDPKVLSITPSIAIVGTRKPTDYGIRVAGRLARDLAARVVVESGLAYGIDTVALTEALASGGKVVAVIGSGLDKKSFYPAINYQLAEKIVVGGGAILSEYPEGTPPLKQHFPARNRIIAGLTAGTVVIEGLQKSGALITAQHALEFGREVFGVPGSIFAPEAWAPNQLIKEGATPISDAAEILAAIGLDAQLPLPSDPDYPVSIEGIIDRLLDQQSLSIDELARELKLDSQLVSSTLTLMEIKGMVKLTPAGKFMRLR